MDLDLITIKEYAQKKGVSYEAVRKQISKYKDNELHGHIVKVKKTQYLDEYAVVFLDEKRRESPVVLMREDRNERIEELERENKALLLKVAELQEQLLQEKDNVKMLQQEKIELLETRENVAKEEKKHWWKIF